MCRAVTGSDATVLNCPTLLHSFLIFSTNWPKSKLAEVERVGPLLGGRGRRGCGVSLGVSLGGVGGGVWLDPFWLKPLSERRVNTTRKG